MVYSIVCLISFESLLVQEIWNCSWRVQTEQMHLTWTSFYGLSTQSCSMRSLVSTLHHKCKTLWASCLRRLSLHSCMKLVHAPWVKIVFQRNVFPLLVFLLTNMTICDFNTSVNTVVKESQALWKQLHLLGRRWEQIILPRILLTPDRGSGA